MVGMADPQPTVRSVERALDVLELLERAQGPMRLVDLSKGSGLSTATVLRIVGVLQRRGLVQHVGGDYRLGVATLGMAHAFIVGDPLSNRTRPHLQQLSVTTGLTSSLYVRSGAERVLSSRVDGADPLRYQLPIGRRLPLTVGAGRTILAHMPADEQEALVASVGELRDANGTPVSTDDLRRSLEVIRADGFHVSIAERDRDVAAVSVPVFGPDGDVVASVSASGPAELNTRQELVDRAPELRRAAQAIGR
jgi:IclR family pca regulon transcriptional regulator/IclR family acetate operon transcriptional repressor